MFCSYWPEYLSAGENSRQGMSTNAELTFGVTSALQIISVPTLSFAGVGLRQACCLVRLWAFCAPWIMFMNLILSKSIRLWLLRMPLQIRPFQSKASTRSVSWFQAADHTLFSNSANEGSNGAQSWLFVILKCKDRPWRVICGPLQLILNNIIQSLFNMDIYQSILLWIH